MAFSLISNPPYNMAWTPPALISFIPKYANVPTPPKNNANYAFVLSALDLVDDKAAMILPNCVLQPSSDAERKILATIVERNFVEAVIQLPDKMFESTGIPTCIVVFNANKQTRQIELVDLSSSAEQVEREQRGQFGGASHTNRVYKKTVNVLTKETMERAVNAIRNFTTEENFSVAVMPEHVAENDYRLTPKFYLASPTSEIRKRSYEDIAADYNRVVRYKNMIRVTFNETAAKRLGYDCLKGERPDLTESFGVVGQKVEKENFVSFTKSDGIKIECSTKDGIPNLIVDFLNRWRLFIMQYNEEENRLLAEFRDALLPDLMSGKIDVSGNPE